MQHHLVLEAAGIGILSWERGRLAGNTPKAWAFRASSSLAITSRRLPRGCFAHRGAPWERRVLTDAGVPPALTVAGLRRRTFGPRSQDMSFPDDPAPTASPLGPGATAWCG